LKNNRHGKAKVLNPSELSRLMTELKKKPVDAALFAICLFTGCRISEALQLTTEDVNTEWITFRKNTTKGKLKTRTVAVSPMLKPYLEVYTPKKQLGFMFPGQIGRKSAWMTRNTADRKLRQACARVGIDGVSTHSFRRTALTYMYRSGIPLRTIQEISGHTNLFTLQGYLDVLPEDVVLAVGSIRF
jgi:integrase/recombinase XerD